MSRTDRSRPYMQSRLRDEIARARRYNTPFTLVQFEAVTAEGLPMSQKMKYALDVVTASVRMSDVVALAFEDTIVALLVQTDVLSAKDALQRIRSRVAQQSGTWRLSAWVFPDDAEAIAALPLLTAAASDGRRGACAPSPVRASTNRRSRLRYAGFQVVP